MSKPVLLDVSLTLTEAKAMARLIAAGIAAVETDKDEVSCPVMLARALESAGRGAEKIRAAMAAAGSPLFCSEAMSRGRST